MIKALKSYLTLYRHFILTSAAVEMSFRSSFILIILMDLFFYITTLSTVSFIYEHVAMIGPWDRNQLMFFIAYALMLDNLHMILISENFWEFSYLLRT